MNLSSLVRSRALGAASLMLVADSAWGHPGHEVAGGGFAAGLGHPLFGLDHLLAMLAVGLFSVRQSAAMGRVVPLLAVGGMLLGAGLAWAGVALPGVEFGIAMSVLLAGVLVAALARVPAALGGVAVVAFMVFHGHAHAAEMPHGASTLLYLAGFSLATLGLTVAGRRVAGWLMTREQRVLRGLGAAIAAMGALFAIG